MNMRIVLLALLVLGGITACGSVPATHGADEPTGRFDPGKDPYWEDPKWDNTLLTAVQSVAHDPADPAAMATPGLHATVKFTYLNGTIEYPEVVTGTGDPELDKLLLHQVASAQIPLPSAGLETDKPHEFVLDLDVPTPFESFQSSVYAAIDARKVYPKETLISAMTGDTRVDFDYLDGKASGIAMTASSNSKDLDKASVNSVTKAVFPQAPAAYAGKTLHMQALFCYTMTLADNGSTFTVKNQCPVGRNVIVVQGTRFKTTGVQTTRMRGA